MDVEGGALLPAGAFGESVRMSLLAAARGACGKEEGVVE